MLIAQTIQPRSEPATARDISHAEIISDCVLLGLITLLPVIPFVFHLGIYADDWGLLALFKANGDRSLLDYFRTFYSLPITQMRPVEVLYKATMYRLFGTTFIGYHAVNAFVFMSSAWLLYLSLRLIVRERFLALTIPLVFILLPNYSSAWFVPFTFMIGLSMAFFFLNFYALLKAAQNAALEWGWTVVSVVALFMSSLAYEFAIPLFALSLLIVWYLKRNKCVTDRPPAASLAVLLGLNAIAVLSVLAFKALTTNRYHGVKTAPGVLRGAVSMIAPVVHGAAHVDFIGLGLKLPGGSSESRLPILAPNALRVGRSGGNGRLLVPVAHTGQLRGGNLGSWGSAWTHFFGIPYFRTWQCHVPRLCRRGWIHHDWSREQNSHTSIARNGYYLGCGSDVDGLVGEEA
jgi:hypothetical protein